MESGLPSHCIKSQDDGIILFAVIFVSCVKNCPQPKALVKYVCFATLSICKEICFLVLK